MDVSKDCSIFRFKRAFISVNFKDESRFSVRLLVWSPPSSLALSRVSYDYFITRTQCLTASKLVNSLCSLGTSVFQPPQNSNSDFPVIAEQLPAILAQRFKLTDRKRL